MKSRLFHAVERFPQPLMEANHFNSINDDVISAKVSDHHPIIHDGVLFWNIMMQGKQQKGSGRYNNGFGMVENETDYLTRLRKVANVIIDILHLYPSIEMIGLCEGPVNPDHINIFIEALKSSSLINRFLPGDEYYHPHEQGFDNWGLMMLADHRYTVTAVESDFTQRPMPLIFDRLANRLQLWQLEQAGKRKYVALGHFPFNGDEYVAENDKLSPSGKQYIDLIHTLIDKRYENEELIICADFNFNPLLIRQRLGEDNIPLSNSRLFITQKSQPPIVHSVMVDGILLSSKESQKYNSMRPICGLWYQLAREYQLASTQNMLPSNDKERGIAI